MIFTSKVAYGLAWDGAQPVLARAARAGGRVRRSPVESGPAGRARIRDEVGGGRASLNAALAAHEAILRFVEVPLAARDKARRVLPSLLDVQLPFPIESCVHELVDLQASPAGGTRALAVAARREDVAAALQRGADAGLDATALDHEALALWEGSRPAAPAADRGWRAALHVAADHTTLALGRDGRFVAAQGFRAGAQDWLDGDKPKGDALAAFATRLQQVLTSQLGDAADQAFAWSLSGSGAASEARARAIQEALRRPAATAWTVPADPVTFLAGALAERALVRGRLACDLRTGEFAHPAAAASRRRAAGRRPLVALAAGLLLACASFGWLQFLAGREAALQEALTRRALKLSGAVRLPRGQEVLTVERALREHAPLARLTGEALQPVLPALLSAVLEAAQEQRLTLGEANVSLAGVEATGWAGDWNAAERLVAAFSRYGWSATVERQEAGADGRVPFMVKGTP